MSSSRPNDGFTPETQLLRREADGERFSARVLTRRDGRSGVSAQPQLLRTIETEVIPRLMLAHRTGTMRFRSLRPVVPTVDADDVEQFTGLLLKSDDALAASRFIETVRDRGVKLETIFLDLLTPSARLLGEYWVEDKSDFADVTIGLGQLRQLLYRYSPEFMDDAKGQVIGKRALLAVVPGEQHSFGLVMLEQFFLKAGWAVDMVTEPSKTSLEALVKKRHFDLVGLSISCDAFLSELTSTINLVRRASKNPQVCVMAGGQVFLTNPQLVDRVGADATAIDGRQAVRQASYARNMALVQAV
jgi:MerR family transcriptional regulator, light-induced transcriptional regulator